MTTTSDHDARMAKIEAGRVGPATSAPAPSAAPKKAGTGKKARKAS